MLKHDHAVIPSIWVKTAKVYKASNGKRSYRSAYSVCYAEAKRQIALEIFDSMEDAFPDIEWAYDEDMRAKLYIEVLERYFPKTDGCKCPSCAIGQDHCIKAYRQYIKDRARYLLERATELGKIRQEKR